ncbi:hypothetical protein ACQAYK_02755 [Acidithiobacillus sp. AC3]
MMDVVPRIGDEKEVGFRSVRSFSAVCNATEFARLFVKRKADCKPTAMPYAVVMATGGTASVAAAANYWLLAATLLTLACLPAGSVHPISLVLAPASIPVDATDPPLCRQVS